MAENVSLALQITALGMSLVFGSIVLLWIVMSALVRLTVDRQLTASEASAEAARRQRRQRAAAAAVAIALARQAEAQPRAFPLPPTAFVSAWQAVMRSRHLKQRGPVR